jgi:large subunit ribosomal protein L4
MKENMLFVIEDFSLESGKTKDMVHALKNITEMKRSVVILPEDNQLTKRAGSNIPWLTVFTYNKLRLNELFYGEKIIIQESAALKLNDFYTRDRV